MEQPSTFRVESPDGDFRPADNDQVCAGLYEHPRWFAVYTRAQHEKVVAQQFREKSIEYYLPLFESVRRWKDRRKLLTLPLFPGYIFVHLSLLERMRVLQISGVVHLVGFNGHPEPLEEAEISAVRSLTASQCRIQAHPFLRTGCRVRVTRGPLAGTEGILVREKKNYRLVMSIELIMRSVSVEIDECDVEAMA
jgi:transcription antitermination factor NusG